MLWYYVFLSVAKAADFFLYVYDKMFYYISGKIALKDNNFVVIDAGGVGGTFISIAELVIPIIMRIIISKILTTLLMKI